MALSVAMAPMWLDYLRVLANATFPERGPLYTLNNVPLLLVPVLAWSGRRRPSAQTA